MIILVITHMDPELAEVRWQIFQQPSFLGTPLLNDQCIFAEHSNCVDELQCQRSALQRQQK